MRVTPVSFGKTVRVFGNRQIAQDMVQLANAKKTKAANTVYQKEIKRVFNDIEITPTNDSQKAMLWETDEGLFILSGKEAKQARRCIQDKIQANEAASEIHWGRVYIYKATADKNDVLMRERIKKLIAQTKEPYAISIGYDNKGKRHIQKINPEMVNQ
ncbi:hypothetical protein IJ425_00880 [bacterium]|nr:hypothetical protein [bacterium]